jgi:hypothetical protein
MNQPIKVPQLKAPGQTEQIPHQLFVVFDQTNLTLKIGTCQHCVVQEQGRPARAWEAEGDKELDFDRDKLVAGLAALGIEVKLESEYVCP